MVCCVCCRAALAEFRLGCAERGRSVFEGVLVNYPKRTDLWNVYLDQVGAGVLDKQQQHSSSSHSGQQGVAVAAVLVLYWHSSHTLNASWQLCGFVSRLQQQASRSQLRTAHVRSLCCSVVAAQEVKSGDAARVRSLLARVTSLALPPKKMKGFFRCVLQPVGGWEGAHGGVLGGGGKPGEALIGSRPM